MNVRFVKQSSENPRKEGISFDPDDGSLSIRLETLARVFDRQTCRLAVDETVAGSALVVFGRAEISGPVRGHVVAVDSEVVLKRGWRIDGYLYLIDSRLGVEDRWPPSQRFHSLLLPEPWSVVVAEAADGSKPASPPASAPRRTWHFERDAPAHGRDPGTTTRIRIDTGNGRTEIRGNPSAARRRFVVDGVDRSSWFEPFADQALTFNGGRVLAFGGDGASYSAARDEWLIPSGNVMVLGGGGYAILGARGGIRYQRKRGLLVGAEALMKCFFPEDASSYEGRELVFRMADQAVEVRR